MGQLHELARPFPKRLVKERPGTYSAPYVSHDTINQRLLEVTGPFSWEIVETILNGDGTLSGCLGRLTVEIDGRVVVITEAGDVDKPSTNNGANLKIAASDAFKRAAMRIGLGLHLWSTDYFLDKSLNKRGG